MRAIVIGSTGGIGSALVAALVDRGDDVTALARSPRAGLAATTSGSIDIAREDSIAAAAARLAETAPFDLMLVATGLLHRPGLAPEKSLRALSADGLSDYFRVNATGPALVAKHFLPLLAPDRRSLFAALSARVGSISDNRLGGWYGYRASKAALNMLIRTAAIELARTRPHAIVVTLHPGTVDTALSAPFQRNVAPDKMFTPAFAAASLLDVLAALTPADSGACFDWRGERIAP